MFSYSGRGPQPLPYPKGTSSLPSPLLLQTLPPPCLSSTPHHRQTCWPAPPPPLPPQRDVLLASSTVRESLTISALLKLPRTLSYADKMARVDAIVSDLVGLA